MRHSAMAAGAIKSHARSPSKVESTAQSIATAYQTMLAMAIEMPVIHSEPMAPKVEAATMPSGRRAANPHEASG